MKREHQPEIELLEIVLPTNSSISTEAAFQVLSACTMNTEFSIATINWFDQYYQFDQYYSCAQ